MSTLAHACKKNIRVLRKLNVICTSNRKCTRNFLSGAYYCNEVWENRFNSPLIKNVNCDEFYRELEQRFNKTQNVSAVDADIFANATRSDSHIDELVDIIHKLRLSSQTFRTLESTTHALVRILLKNERFDLLLDCLDDRLNFGIFLDNFTANIIFDTLWKKQQFTLGARTASQLMLQEDFSHPITTLFSMLHCYKFLEKPEGWPEAKLPEEPTEEVKVRVKFLRNDYFDDHFDLRNPFHLTGKTLSMAADSSFLNDDILRYTLKIMGLALYEKYDFAEKYLHEVNAKNKSVYSQTLSVLPDGNKFKDVLKNAKLLEGDLESILADKLREAEKLCAERDIAEQCKIYSDWEKLRESALDEQEERFRKIERLNNVENIAQELKDKETKLWYFENEEKIELQIDAKKVTYPKRWFGKKKKPRKIDEGYVPPEIQKSFSR